MTHNTTEPTFSRRRLPALLLIVTATACMAAVGDEPDASTPRDAEHAANELTEAVASATEIWDAACPHAPVNGLCLAFEKVEPTVGCAERMLGRVTVAHRSGPEAVRANEAFDDALAAVSGEAPTDPVARAAVRKALGRAQLAQLDADLEAYFAMRIEVPGLGAADTTLEDPATLATFKTAFETKARAGAALTLAYAEIKDTDDPESLIRAALRTTWLPLHLVDEVMSIAVPGDKLASGERASYCDALREQTAAAVATSLTTARWCVETAHKRGYTGPEVAQCEALVQTLETVGPATKQVPRDG